eukprot:CAMPEP_0174856740 /NCGR_PEP_ID=MMETSP1114-20130205/36194_1 /TAXON_ID=312471 /ORGANISM="Neobodo designis, Strain CCAP 1951/1" /LENGTH=175 /DNA_ID=CAMNT_0016091545 /DNA_START=51 /DNA_END=575 /DNA_ORIENTATION=-
MSRSSVPKTFFASERKQHFNKKVRTEGLNAARQKRDADTKRIEEYRRMCEREGIQSKRLEEIDKRKAELRNNTEETIQSIRSDASLTNAERKRRIFNAKRKLAASSPLEAKRAGKSRFERLEAEREAEREAAEAEKQRKIQERRDKRMDRSRRNRAFAERTRTGQPVLASRVSSL